MTAKMTTCFTILNQYTETLYFNKKGYGHKFCNCLFFISFSFVIYVDKMLKVSIFVTFEKEIVTLCNYKSKINILFAIF